MSKGHKRSVKHSKYLTDIGGKLSVFRTEAHSKQVELSQILECSRSHLVDIENGGTDITLWEFKTYCELYGIDATDLMFGGSGMGTPINKNFYVLGEYEREQINNFIEMLTSEGHTNKNTYSILDE